MWFRRAAEQGYSRAEYRLAASYEFGRGVPEDFSEAAKWYEKAVDAGDFDALYPLGSVSAKMGDVVSAYAWLNIYTTRQLAHPDALKLKERVAEQMSPAEILEAQTRSTAWCASSRLC